MTNDKNIKNTTENKEKRNNVAKRKRPSTITVIIILLIIAVLIFACIKLFSSNNNNESKSGENSVYSENGEKLNTSNALKKSKKVDDYTIDNISLGFLDNVTTMKATVTNNSSDKKENVQFEITLLDKDNNKIETLIGYISSIDAKGSQNLNVSVEGDYIDAYDFDVKIIE